MRLHSMISVCLGLLLSLCLLPAHADTTAVSINPNSALSDPAQTIQVNKTNSQFIITLPANRTTGYSWHLINYNNQLITLVSHVYQAPSQTMPGKGGREIWTFQAQDAAFTTPQTTKITLLYAQPWNMQKNTKQAVFTVSTNNS